ncbi:MAG: DUF1893 domain-containing protein [Gallicola sp.]|nr:DUF1893 domain-containing protein [Gallicola sp.]
MKDIEIAVKELEKGKSIVFVKNGRILFEDKAKGIRPILKALNEKGLEGSSAADTVVGLAHAMISAEIPVKEVYGKVLSKSAKDFLEKKKIPFTYDILVDRILNKKEDDLCPMEKRAQESQDTKELVEKIETFFQEMRK